MNDSISVKEHIESLRYIDSDDYIAACIETVIEADADTRKQHYLRAVDLANAVRIAAKEGEEAAYNYLLRLSDEALVGKYEST